VYEAGDWKDLSPHLAASGAERAARGGWE
jgi:hypothetical protein